MTLSPKVRLVETSRGTARAHLWPAVHPRTALVLGHGAGGGVESPDLRALAEALPYDGIGVVLVEQPWRVAGRRLAERPAVLDTAWVEVLRDLSAHELRGSAPVVGGRSAGARVACRTAAAVGATGVICLAFPLHPPGRPGASRADELRRAAHDRPVTVIQGQRDPFGSPGEVTDSAPQVDVNSVAWADHAFSVPAAAPVTQRETLGSVVSTVRASVVRMSAPR